MQFFVFFLAAIGSHGIPTLRIFIESSMNIHCKLHIHDLTGIGLVHFWKSSTHAPSCQNTSPGSHRAANTTWLPANWQLLIVYCLDLHSVLGLSHAAQTNGESPMLNASHGNFAKRSCLLHGKFCYCSLTTVVLSERKKKKKCYQSITQNKSRFLLCSLRIRIPAVWGPKFGA